MGLIRLQNVNKQFGERLLLDDVTLELNSSQRVGLVGPNGAGKTTLFKLIAGITQPDSGAVTVSRGMKVGYLPQDPEVGLDRTLHDEVLSAFADILAIEERMHEISDRISHTPPGAAQDDLMREYDRTNARFVAAGGYSFEQRLGEILGGLGFTESDYSLPMTALSGGQKCRAALAKLLLDDSEFLLLDEPTNHLDIDAVRWLERFLVNHHGGAVIISHDRYLLDRVADCIIELDQARFFSFPGNYSNYIKTRDVRRLTQVREFEKDQEFIAKEREFIARHMGSQRTAEAKGRLTRLERRIADGEFVLEKPAERGKVRFTFDGADPGLLAGRDIVEASGLAKKYDSKQLFTELTLRVAAGQRLGITGPNGTGKTTLLRILLDRVKPDAGEVRWNPKASIGYFAQDAADLHPEMTIVQEIQTVRPEMLESHVRTFAALFLFKHDDPFKRIASLSGGEQSRVRLMKLILRAPNVLVMDEPTNHLDIPSREVLEDALSDFPGTLIAVSHDRYFLDRMCNRLLVVRPEGWTVHQGNYSSYIEKLEADRAADEARRAAEARAGKEGASRSGGESSASAQRGGDTAGNSRGAKAGRSGSSKAPRPKTKYTRMSLEELEAFIATTEAGIHTLTERFGDPRIYQDAAALAKLQAELDGAKSALTAAEEEWLFRAES
ncbi:MAG: ABC-F family ATP-binding cassette domain-containing protein [Phycisphaerales bacterium]|nr:ABC-F family ATP-binding cassette domain-containing protein [Phycisphaerales bacterium]